MILLGVVYLAATATVLIVKGLALEVLATTALVFGVVALFMTAMFVLASWLKRIDLVDVSWGLAFIVAGITAFISGGHMIDQISVQLVILLLVTIWGGRLALSISLRLLRHEEDKRYVSLRKKWKGSVLVNTYLRVFLLQAILATVISTAIIYAGVAESKPLETVTYIGIGVWMVGFFFEVVGDAQLKRFIGDKTNRGKLMTKGLWHYTRHPNYFGEATMWWGIWIATLGLPYGWMSIITPLVITYLLLYVSGVPMTEQSSSKKPGWKTYAARTSKFLPMLPKKV